MYRQCSLQGFTSRFGMLQSSWFSSWPKQKIGDKIVSETTWLQHFWLDQHHLPSLNFRWTFRLSVTLFYSTFLISFMYFFERIHSWQIQYISKSKFLIKSTLPSWYWYSSLFCDDNTVLSWSNWTFKFRCFSCSLRRRLNYRRFLASIKIWSSACLKMLKKMTAMTCLRPSTLFGEFSVFLFTKAYVSLAGAWDGHLNF